MMHNFRERWHHMSQRERMLVLAGGVVVGFSLLFVLIVDPLLDNLERLDRQAVRKQKELTELASLGQSYLTKRDRLSKVEGRMPAAESHFSLLTFMEEAATTAQVRERITSMQPHVQSLAQGYQETAVDLRLEGIQLPELLAFLATIDQAPYDLHVRHLQIRPKFDNPVNLDATVRVLSYAKS
ncbi:MAG: type II secretion system protein M [Nitrospira sp.]|nr:type II secretion system protein M [Nitrospira sp.]MBS0153174.1 type II secretion system protein M [Nitrospira sp.]